jgi:hypothetical protein
VLNCFKVGKTAAETNNMLCEAHSDGALSQTMTYEWFKRFKNERTSTDDDELTFNFKIQTSACPGETHYPWKSLTDCLRSCRRG